MQPMQDRVDQGYSTDPSEPPQAPGATNGTQVCAHGFVDHLLSRVKTS